MNVADGIQPWMLLALVGGVLVVVAVVRATVKATTRTRQVSRMGATTGRTLLTTGVIVAGQWLLITRHANWPVIVLALGVPAFITAGHLVRLLTVTSTETITGKGGKP